MAERKKTEEQNEMVTIRLFKDNGKYKNDLFISVNGRRYQIKRGVDVAVPPEVAEIIEHSQIQDELTAQNIARSEVI